MHNQAFNADSLQRGICFANFAPRCKPLRRQAGSVLPVNLALCGIVIEGSGTLKVVYVPREFFAVRGVSDHVEPNLFVLRQPARAAGE